MAASIDTAVRLVQQAIAQDTKKNYEEAGRCYREALLIFHQLRRTPHNNGHRIRDFLNTKVVQYEERLRAIDAYLLAQNDWTKFFRDIEPSLGEENTSCSSSSRSSETKQLYRNPLLVSALDSLRRGRKADDRYDYRTALEAYSNGLKAMQAVINRGILTSRQEAAARAKCLVYHDRAEAIRAALEAGGRLYTSGRRDSGESCLSLNSASDSPVPATEAENLMEMEEVHSCCSSRLGSISSLHHHHQHQDEEEEGADLNRTHAVLHASLPHLAAIPGGGGAVRQAGLAHHRSLHSVLATGQQQQHHPAVLRESYTRGSSKASYSPNRETTPPLVCLDTELNISSLSMSGQGEQDGGTAERDIILITDTLEAELINLAGSCEDIKCRGSEYEESDSGYSDPSPDGGGGCQGLLVDYGEKSPSSPDNDRATMLDRKSMFSDLSEEEEDDNDNDNGVGGEGEYHHQHDIFPTVIIKNQATTTTGAEDGGQLEQRCSSSPTFGRQYGRQRSVFQTPGKDILTSLVSRDDLAVIGQDSVDAAAVGATTLKERGRPAAAGTAPENSGVRPSMYDETYRRSAARSGGHRPLQAAVPSRAAATRDREEKPEKNGCFYVMTALDFCWCL